MNRNRTYLVKDDDGRMRLHKCEWDENHIEKPSRLDAIMDSIQVRKFGYGLVKNGFSNSGLTDKCINLESRFANLDDIKLVHSEEYISKIKAATEYPTKVYLISLTRSNCLE